MNDALTAYAKTGNPIHAWRAYEDSRRAGESIPDLVLQYFDRVATRFSAMAMIESVARGARKRPEAANRARAFAAMMGRKYGLRPGTPAESVWRALEMDRRGRGSVFERDEMHAKLGSFARYVAEEILVRGTKLDLATQIVAQEIGVSRTTVRRAWSANPGMLAQVRHWREERGLPCVDP